MILVSKSLLMVSIIMPAFNRAFTISSAIESVINQTYENWELIIVDDCSNDNTPDLVNNYQKKDKRIYFIRLEENSGACVARNKGIDMAKGDYITFLDSDDEYLPQKIEKQLVHFNNSKINNLGVVSCGRIDWKDGAAYHKSIPQKKANYFKSLLSKESRIGAGTPFLMVKASVIKEEGILFDPAMPAMQDWDFLLRICRNHEFSFVPDYLVKVNHHQSERVYNSYNAVKAIKLQYSKYHNWLKEDPESYFKFVKNAGILITHHESVEKAIELVEGSRKDFNNIFKIRLSIFQVLLGQFKYEKFKLFYLKFFR